MQARDKLDVLLSFATGLPYRAMPARPTPLAPTLSEHLPQDPIWNRKGRFQVQIGPKSGAGGGVSERVGARGVGPAGMALYVPRKYSTGRFPGLLVCNVLQALCPLTS